MPAVTSSDQATLATHPQTSRMGMAILRPKTIVTAQVSGAPAIGATSITLTSIVTTETPDAHYTVIIGSTAGNNDGGKVRLKSLVGSTLTVAANNLDWNTYRFVSIRKIVEPWSILPDLGNDKEDSNVAYTNQTNTYHPLGRIGPPAVGWVNQAIKFWSSSQVVAAGATLSSHAWTFPGGSPASSASAGSEASPISVTWAAATGHIPHYVKYVVTDSNGKTHTRYTPVWVFDSFDDSYCDWELESLSGDYDSGGWQARVRVFGDATPVEFPEDAMVVLFAEDRYAGHKTSIGGNWGHRENIVFMGWIARDSVTKDAEKGDVSFEILGPALKMKELNCWPANLEYKNSPAHWHELKGMTCDRAAFHILTEHTTMDLICDFVLTGNTKVMRFIDIPEGDPYQQIDEYCMKPIGARLLSDRQGRLYLSRNPNLRPTSERSSIATVISLDINSDIRADPGLELAMEEHEYQVSQVDFVAFKYDGADARAIYSLAPATQYPTGRVEKVDGIRADSQSEANQLAGLYLANLNNIWREVRLPMFNHRIFDIVPEEYTHLTLAAGDTRRGVTWTNQDLICRAVEIEYDTERGAILVTPSFEKDSFGPSGVTGDYPVEPPNGVWDFPPPELPAWPPVVTLDPQSLLAFDSVNGCYWRDLSGAWQERNGGLSGADIQDQQGGWDPWWFTPEKQGTSDPTKAILFKCDVGKIYRSTDCGVTWTGVIPTAGPNNDFSQTPAPTAATVTYIQRTDNIHRNKHHYFLAEYSDGTIWGGWILVTQDDGTTWTWYSLSKNISGMSGNDPYYPTGLAISKNENNAHTFGTQVFSLEAPDGVGMAATFVTLHEFNSLVHLDFDLGGTVYGDGVLFPQIRVRGLDQAVNPPQSSTIGNFTENDGIEVSLDGVAWTPNTTAWWTSSDLTGSWEWGSLLTTPLNAFRYVRLIFRGAWQCDALVNPTGYIDAVEVSRVDHVEDPGGLPDQVRPIWMDVDTETGDWLFITAWVDSTLRFWVLDLDDLSNAEPWIQEPLGACTIEELAAKTWMAYPFTVNFNQDVVYIFGRTNHAALGTAHIIKYTLDLTTPSAGTPVAVVSDWGADHCGAFRAEGETDNQRTLYAVRNSGSAVPKLYRAIEPGAIGYLSDVPFASGVFVLVDGMTIKTADGHVALGSNAAGATMIVQSADNGATWGDITPGFPVTGSVRTLVYV